MWVNLRREPWEPACAKPTQAPEGRQDFRTPLVSPLTGLCIRMARRDPGLASGFTLFRPSGTRGFLRLVCGQAGLLGPVPGAPGPGYSHGVPRGRPRSLANLCIRIRPKARGSGLPDRIRRRGSPSREAGGIAENGRLAENTRRGSRRLFSPGRAAVRWAK